MYNLRRLTAIDGDAILSMADARSQCRVIYEDDDADIAAARNAAINHVEMRAGVALAPSQFRWSLPNFYGAIVLPMGPVTTIDDIVYNDGDGVEMEYVGGRLVESNVYPAVGEYWPTAYDFAAVTFTAGLTNPSEAPDLLMAIRLLTSHYFDNRQAVTLTNTNPSELPLGVTSLIASYRKMLS